MYYPSINQTPIGPITDTSTGDDERPKCGRCRRLGKPCIRATGPRWKFRHQTSGNPSVTRESPSAEGQPALEFIDEAPVLTAPYAQETNLTSPAATATPAATPIVHLTSTSPVSPFQTPESGSGSGSWKGKQSPGLQDATNISLVSLFRPNRPDPPWTTLFGGETVYLQLSQEETCVLRYFVEEMAKWFDICDIERHFGIVVPQRARKCPTLLNAILSATTRFFSTLPKSWQLDIIRRYGFPADLVIGDEIMLHYHSKCIAQLRMASEQPDALMDEDLLAAVVVLRFYEELDSPFIPLPNETAVRGLQVFIEAQATSALAAPGYRQALFWIGFRQELNMSILQQRPFRHPLTVCEEFRPWPNAPDHVWVNHLLVINAHIVQYCFGDECQQSYTRYNELVQQRKQWIASCPVSFIPVYFEEANKARGELFPQMWYLSDCHIVAVQTLALTNILLTTYNPHNPRMGHNYQQAMARINTNIKASVLEICGVALSNRQSPTALLTACMGIMMCGERFTDRGEQNALMRILVDMSRENNYWPTKTAQARMEEVWGWSTDP